PAVRQLHPFPGEKPEHEVPPAPGRRDRVEPEQVRDGTRARIPHKFLRFFLEEYDPDRGRSERVRGRQRPGGTLHPTLASLTLLVGFFTLGRRGGPGHGERCDQSRLWSFHPGRP